jgi:CBS domain-containing protein
MTRDVICVTPEATRGELLKVLLSKGISGVPVIDEDGRPLGVASKTDVLRGLGAEDANARAADIMTPVTLAMPEHASIARAAALMAYERVHRVIVIGPAGNVVGLVSTIDVLRWLAREDGYAVP